MDTVPVRSFGDVDASRLATVVSSFKELYPDVPITFFARAPGRVNLIGEHVDYSGYPVLPMAIDPDSILAVSVDPKADACTISNVNSKFPPETFPITLDKLKIDDTIHSWTNYVKCGYKGILENTIKPINHPIAFKAVIYGTVPMGSGLSSSSALVCASALATMHAHNLNLSKKDIAEICKNCEHYIGTYGGGMDQAISFLGTKGAASKISFNPVSALNVSLPDDCVFFVANSLVESTKFITADTCYNMRVVECRLAAKLLAKALNQDWNKVSILKHVQDFGNFSLEEMIKHTNTFLHEQAFTRSEISALLGITDEDLNQNSFIGIKVKSNEFHLHKRALHVFLESKLVQEFATLCQQSEQDSQKSKKLGNLMSASHNSCRDYFNCSCPDLDNLVEICLKAGAYGSRLTGAGWGGCTVSIVPTSGAAKFFEEVKREYFEKYFPELIKQNGIENYFFQTAPGEGAFVVVPN